MRAIVSAFSGYRGRAIARTRTTVDSGVVTLLDGSYEVARANGALGHMDADTSARFFEAHAAQTLFLEIQRAALTASQEVGACLEGVRFLASRGASKPSEVADLATCLRTSVRALGAREDMLASVAQALSDNYDAAILAQEKR